VTVRTAWYGQKGGEFKAYSGKVIPHSDFRIVLVDEDFVDENGIKATRTVVSERQADLALVQLVNPVEEVFSYAQFHKADVSVPNSVTVTGFGAVQIDADGRCVYGASPDRSRLEGTPRSDRPISGEFSRLSIYLQELRGENRVYPEAA
jgi:hypothetical protein